MFKQQYPNKIFTPTSLLSICDIEEFKVKLFSITAYNLVHLYLYVCLLIFKPYLCTIFKFNSFKARKTRSVDYISINVV